jgi:hypothetical protein
VTSGNGQHNCALVVRVTARAADGRATAAALAASLRRHHYGSHFCSVSVFRVSFVRVRIASGALVVVHTCRWS